MSRPLRALPYLAVPLLVLALVWAPVLERVAVPTADVTPQMIETARLEPAEKVLEELRTFYLLPFDGRSPEMETTTAEAILNGRLSLPDLPEALETDGFEPGDLDQLPSPLQLAYAGWTVPDFLLAGFVNTGRDVFFERALAFIEAWDAFERSPLPRAGLLWNDHAVAARVRVLAEFWRLYRARPDYRPDIGRTVLELADRYGHLLASPRHFTFATNHGIIQNLALLHLRIAFPSLPDSERYHAIALERLAGQMEFLVDDEGVMRENSAGYQAFDLALFSMTFRAMTLLGDPIPPAWVTKYDRAVDFLTVLQRPDDTLPATGDTDGGRLTGFPPITEVVDGVASSLRPLPDRPPITSDTLKASSGYWVSWHVGNSSEEAASQTVVTWTRPPAPSHKHADELSLLVWADGVSWLTSVGYWPYDDDARSDAESWQGANAPHAPGEAATSPRSVAVLGTGNGEGLVGIDVERSGPDVYRARRQVVRLGGDTWLVLDYVDGAPDGTRTAWTFSPDVDVRSGGDGSYHLQAGGRSGTFGFLGSAGTSASTRRGSLTPFAGWSVVDGEPRAAPAIVVDQPGSTSWLAAVLTVGDGVAEASDLAPRVREASVTAVDDWKVTVATSRGKATIVRSGPRVEVTPIEGPVSRTTMTFMPGPNVASEQARLAAAFEAMADDYPQYQALISRRTLVSAAIVGLLVLQEGFFVVVRRLRSEWVVSLRALSLVAWGVLALWLGAVFLRTWVVLTLG